MHSSWADAQVVSSPVRLQNLTYNDENALHLKEGRFREQFKTWNVKDVTIFLQFFEIGSFERRWTANSLGWKMELCIQQIHRLAAAYLSGAEAILTGAPILRRTVTGLHWPTSRCAFLLASLLCISV